MQLAISDSVLAAAYHVGLKLYSITTSDSLHEQFYFPTAGPVGDIAFRGNTGVISCVGLWSVDFTDPSHPRSKYKLPTQSASPIVGMGDVFYFTDGLLETETISIVKLTENDSLYLLSTIPFIADDDRQSIAVRDSLLFIGVIDSAVIFNVANPLTPQRLGKWTVNNQAYTDVNALGNYLYVAQWGGYGNGGLKIFDITNPSSPLQVGSIFSSAFGVLAEDTLVYVGVDTGLAIVNVSNPSSPTIVAQIGLPEGGSSVMSKSGNYVYSAGVYRVYAIDVSNIGNPVLVGTFAIPTTQGTIWGMVAMHDTVFLAAGWSGVWVVKNDIATSVKENSKNHPTEFELMQNYPNPFNPSTTITYEIPKRTHVTLEIYDVLGRRIATLVNQMQDEGKYKTIWDANKISSGVYFYRLTAGQQVFVKKMVIIR
jgi:hypothetical protein